MAFDEPESSLGSKSLSATSQFPQSQASPIDNAKRSPFFPIFRLPFELRRMIFIQHTALSRAPTGSDIHLSYLPAVWKDIPSPLLGTCRQIRREVLDIFRQNHIFALRVTTFGVAFDMLSLSCFIAQGLPKSYIGLSGLQIEIWPPDHDENRRRLEMLYLHEHLRKLRNKLRAGSRIPKLRICFRENELVKWSHEKQPRQTLKDHDLCKRNDMEIVLDLFSRITNVDKVTILLPRSLKWHADIRKYAGRVRLRMERGFLEYDLDIYNLDTDLKNEGHNNSVLDDPFILDTQHSETKFRREIKTDDGDPFAIDFRKVYMAWYSDCSPFLRKYSLISDFQNIKLDERLARYRSY